MSVYEFRKWIEQVTPLWALAIPIVIVLALLIVEKRRK